MTTHAGTIIPEFMMYEDGLDELEIKDISSHMKRGSRSGKDKFRLFTDILTEFVGTGDYLNRTDSFLSMCAKACFLRGMYGYNQILSKGTENTVCKGYAAAAYCRQSLDPRWLNNLRNYTNHAWQSKNYVAFAELSAQLASVLIDLGYNERAEIVANDSIEKVTDATKQDEAIRTKVQASLLEIRIRLAYLAALAKQRGEALIRLDSAEETAKLLKHRLAQAKIEYHRAHVLMDSSEYDKAQTLLNLALRKFEEMGYLNGVADTRNLRGIIFLNKGQLQDARDQFEEILVLQQQLNNQIGLVRTLINVGEIDRALGQLDQMETYNQRALEISQEAEYMRGMATAKTNLADVALRRGDFDRAIELYKDVLSLSRCAGMKSLHLAVLFLVSDANYLKGNLSDAMNYLVDARKVAQELNYRLSTFNADVGEIVTAWAMGTEPEPGKLEHISTVMHDLQDWIDAGDSSLMVDVRRQIFDDDSIDSNFCVFYDAEKNFECRVDRASLRKECFGNLFWNGSLCPYFIKFMEHL